MNRDMCFEIEDLSRERLNKYTRKAFRMVPPLDRARILDVGCGRGVPTLELARLGQGQVIGVDIHQPFIDILTVKARKAGLSHQVRAMNCSMFNMDFPDKSFDIIWTEGSIFIIGFKKGIKEWQRFIKPGGFLVVHDAIKNIPGKPDQVTNVGYDLIGYFILPHDTWWSEYYAPLEKRIREFRIKYMDNPGVLAALQKEQQEVHMFKKLCGKKNCMMYATMFLVMQKR